MQRKSIYTASRLEPQGMRVLCEIRSSQFLPETGENDRDAEFLPKIEDG